MEPSPVGVLIPELTQRPTSVFLHGSNRALLNWVMYALLDRSDPNFRWTDVHLRGRATGPTRPSRAPRHPRESAEPCRTRRVSNAARTPPLRYRRWFIRRSLAESIRRALAFLRLPSHTQDLISRTSPGGSPAQVGMSNGHRLLAAFPAATVQPTIRAILDSGVTFVMTWADAVPSTSKAFDFVLGVEGAGPADWNNAVLNCGIGNSVGPVRAGKRLRLGELGPIANVLGPMGLSRT